MKHLLEAWEEFESLVEGCSLLLLLDYDGTLAPIVENPSLAKISLSGKKILRKIAQQQGIQTAIVSGRVLTELKKLVAIPSLTYVGNHGLEMEEPHLHFVHPKALEAKKIMEKVKRDLQNALESFTGIFVEDKVLTLSVHYRQVPEEKIEEAKQTFLKKLHPYQAASQVMMREGKKVWEVRPCIRWDKGTTVLWLYGRFVAHAGGPVFPIYVGDDETDEDAFRAVKQIGLGIKVTENAQEPSAAHYFLRSPDEVFHFIERINHSYAGNRTAPHL